MLKIIKLFKYEIIKILVFLFLFGCSLVFVLAAQGNYYNKNTSRENYQNNTFSIEKTPVQDKTKN